MTYADLGSQLAILRQRRGLTLAQLAEAADTSPQSINQVEKGRTATPLPKLERIAKVLRARLVVAVVAEDDTDAEIVARIQTLLPLMNLSAYVALGDAITVLEELTRPEK